MHAQHLNKIRVALDDVAINGKFDALVKTDDHVELKALVQGNYEVPFRFMDKDTLYADSFNVPVSLAP